MVKVEPSGAADDAAPELYVIYVPFSQEYGLEGGLTP